MWKPYLKVIAECAGQAVHVLDRYHVMAQMNKAIDAVRASEVKRLKADGHKPVLKHSRWLLLKRPENLTDNQQPSRDDSREEDAAMPAPVIIVTGVSRGIGRAMPSSAS